MEMFVLQQQSSLLAGSILTGISATGVDSSDIIQYDPDGLDDEEVLR